MKAGNTLVILFLCLVSCQNVDSIVTDIAEFNIVEEEKVGLAGVRSSQYTQFEKLKNKVKHQKRNY